VSKSGKKTKNVKIINYFSDLKNGQVMDFEIINSYIYFVGSLNKHITHYEFLHQNSNVLPTIPLLLYYLLDSCGYIKKNGRF